ncbi:transcription-repair coupling factor [Maricaulis maris]|uniref:Transcription-repair-coupling factor n=2 Tax=Maricaulis maris TaxID=74318 RepID=A0A495DJN7_9PROT|nr:transcription-repair coupling factor [Maricaulis maris]RKR02841.1 transcription-repair coupling factor [Maricaulis maris]
MSDTTTTGLSEIEMVAAVRGQATVCGAPEGLDALVFADTARLRGGVNVFIARDDSRAAAFVSALQFFAPDTELLRLPAWDCQPYDRISPSPRVAARRAATLARLASGTLPDTVLVVTTVNAMAQRVPPRAVLQEVGIAVRPGGSVDLDALIHHFTVNGYARAATVMEPGDFAVRGGVVDVYPPGAAEPVRLDFFGDTLESIRAFDPETQRSLRQLKSIDFTPVSEVLLDEASISRFRSGFVKTFGAVRGGDPVYEAVSAGARPAGVEHWMPLFYDQLDTPFDYLPDNSLIAIDHLADEALDERLSQVSDYYDARIAAGESKHETALSAPTYRALPAKALYFAPQDWDAALKERPVRRYTAFREPGGQTIDIGGKQGRGFTAERAAENTNVFDAVASHIKALTADGKTVMLASWTGGASERLASVLHDHGIARIPLVDNWRDVASGGKGGVCRAVLPLERGFETGTLAVLSEQDILGDRLARPRKKRKSADIIVEAGSLSPGDLVIHADHGLGRFLGLKTLPVQDAPHDCIELEYAGAAKLYLPVENIELLSRYGAESETAQLDKLGGVAWQARKAKAKKRLRDMADQLIKIAAQRLARTADPIEPASGVFDEFCAAFPYPETDDQLNAIDDVLTDLGRGRPMDRLICGDVGFGKTEVALRAAFVVALSGQQVAVVAPTTLLARQHFKTFSDRFRGWPVKVRLLSRLVTAKEAKATRDELAAGKVEIVIGTHALLAKTVKFADLGLLVVDEEQHFGVKHKERLKELRSDVHVLTLTATPIPRTLQLALTGIRDLSIIATPPVDRLAVRTYVAPFDPVSVREALLREKYRGGQAFFVVPRISDLEETVRFLTDSVPEISFVAAHGQMAASQLEDIMTAFYEGRYDVLLSTTIIESGIDIPTANTLIVHRADRFGLSQLYQLRGRVGRSKTRAYAYLTTPMRQKITESAEKRLKVMQSLDSLGAGFTLASHDLDLRGGGNLLGEEQSGHIKDVGVELYQSMLEEAVASLRSGGDESDEGDWSPQINAGGAVLIPDHYVPDLDVRLQLYRRLSSLDEKAEREGYAAELIDRFGPLPREVETLLRVVAVKALCKKAGIEKVDAGPKGAVIHFRNDRFADPAGLIAHISANPALFKVRPDHKLVLRAEWDEPEDRLRAIERAMAPLAELATKAKQA